METAKTYRTRAEAVEAGRAVMDAAPKGVKTASGMQGEYLAAYHFGVLIARKNRRYVPVLVNTFEDFPLDSVDGLAGSVGQDGSFRSYTGK